MRYVAVDTETTGLYKPFPIELAAVYINNLEKTFCERIKLPFAVDIEPSAQAVHGITKQCLSNCRSEQEVLTDFIKFVTDGDFCASTTTLVAHNAKFDKKVLDEAFIRNGFGEFINNFTWACTMQISKSLAKQSNNIITKHKLSDCCERANIPYEFGHSALPDAIMCARVFTNFTNFVSSNTKDPQINEHRDQNMDLLITSDIMDKETNSFMNEIGF